MARISLLVPDSRPNAVWIDRVYLQGGVGSTAILSVDSPAAIHLLNGNKYLTDTSERETRVAKLVCDTLFAVAHVENRHVIELPLGKQTALLRDDGDGNYLVPDE